MYELAKSWAYMMSRCYNNIDPAYGNYGGRGIKVCERWHDYHNFAQDVGEKPQGMSLDRMDNEGNYSPENVRWADPVTQGNNRRTNRFVEMDGRRQTVAQWAREYRVDAAVVHARIKLGWPFLEALTTPLRERQEIVYQGEKKSIVDLARQYDLPVNTTKYRLANGIPLDQSTDRTRKLCVNGETHSLFEWSIIKGINIQTIRSRLSQGWDVVDALNTPVRGRVEDSSSICTKHRPQV